MWSNHENPNRGEKMLDRYENRTKGLMATKLDMDALRAYAVEYIRVVYGSDYSDNKHYLEIYPLAIVKIDEPSEWTLGSKKLAVVINEGVGWVESEGIPDGLIPIPLNVSQYQIGGIEMRIHPRVLARFITSEQVDLADWVRVFGDRLETNLMIWQGKTRGVEQDFSEYLETAE
jgi:hypothetical protein